MFNKYVSDIDKNWDKFQAITKNATNSDVENILNGSIETIDDFAILLSKNAQKNYLEEMAQIAKDKTIKRFGKTIKMYVPLYVSNYCSNGCLYCSFSAVNKINRACLTIEQAEKEFKALKNMGFKNILIVSGEDKKNVTVDYLAKLIKLGKKYVPSISIEVAPQEQKDYEKLVDAGLDGTTIYQETYNKTNYKKFHRGTKANYTKRLDYLDYAAKAKIRRIGLGALLGLYEPLYEAMFLYEHIKYLYKNYWQSSLSLSFPRMRPFVGGFQPEAILDDKSLVQFISAFRIAFNELDLVLSTREEASFRDNMALLGITTMSAGSKTIVGGYAKNYTKDIDSQFEIADKRTVPEVVNALKNQGIEPVWKDWESEMYGY